MIDENVHLTAEISYSIYISYSTNLHNYKYYNVMTTHAAQASPKELRTP